MNIKPLLKSSIIFCMLATPLFAFAKINTIATDASITASVSHKLSTDQSLSGTNIDVKTVNGVVSLSGAVDSDTQASAATEIAQSTSFVKDVDTDNLAVKGSQHLVADSIITAKIKGMFIQKKLYGDNDIAAMSIKVETNNGIVSLSGTADNQKQIDNAIDIAKSISGVKSVESSITLNNMAQ